MAENERERGSKMGMGCERETKRRGIACIWRARAVSSAVAITKSGEEERKASNCFYEMACRKRHVQDRARTSINDVRMEGGGRGLNAPKLRMNSIDLAIEGEGVEPSYVSVDVINGSPLTLQHEIFLFGVEKNGLDFRLKKRKGLFWQNILRRRRVTRGSRANQQ